MLSVKMPRKDVVKLVEVPVPTPAKGEVLVKVKASALCRSDMHVLHRVMFDLCGDSEDYMISPGHEPSGVVEALGEGVTKVKVGDRVALFLAIGCGHCRHCKEGNIVLCPDLKMISRDRDGAHADYLTIPEECCLPMPDDMDFVTAALSTDVGGTLYTACKRLGVTKDTSVAIFGVGPMGMGGVIIASALGAKVIAVDGNPERLASALENGAQYAVDCTKENAVERIRELTGEGCDAAIVCVGAKSAINGALDATRPLGTVGLIGEINESTFSPSLQMMRKLLTMKGCWYFNRNDWQEISDFMTGKTTGTPVPIHRIATRTYRLEEAVEAFELFDSGKVQKVVFVWG